MAPGSDGNVGTSPAIVAIAEPDEDVMGRYGLYVGVVEDLPVILSDRIGPAVRLECTS